MKDDMPITVAVKVGIRADGEITRLTITQDGAEICLTYDQARSLVTTINARLPQRDGVTK